MININTLKINLNRSFGRNGKLLCRTKGSIKIKVLYRVIDFYLNFLINNIFIYISYVHDFFRNVKLVLCLNISGFLFYVIGASKLIFPCFFNLSNSLMNINKKFGYPSKINELKEGDFIFNIPLYKKSFGQLCRAAGKYAQIVKLFFLSHYSLIKLKNGNKILTFNLNNVFYGSSCNEFYHNLINGRAGTLNKIGFKSMVRGIAKNPVDHPNGGRTPGGKVYRSFSFKISKSLKKTRKFHNRFII